MEEILTGEIKEVIQEMLDELRCALKQLYEGTLNRHRIDGLEVDVFIQEKNTCIEYNGCPWHKGKYSETLTMFNE